MSLALNPEGTIVADNILIFFVFFRENKAWYFMWIVCLADNWHEISSLIFSEKYKKKKKKKKSKCCLLQYCLAF